MRFIPTQSIALFANTWWKQGYYRAGGPPICEEGWVAAPCNDFALSRSISVASTQALMVSPSEHLAAILVSPTRRKNLAPLS